MGENISKPAKRTNKRIAFGKWGESLAADYLVEKGYTLVVTNFRTPDGEIDLVVQKDGELVFVEVKTRRNVRFGMPPQRLGKPGLRSNWQKISGARSFLLIHGTSTAAWILAQQNHLRRIWKTSHIT